MAVPDGSYFFIVNMELLDLNLPRRSSEESADVAELEPYDYAICRWLTEEIGVTAIPPSAFYSAANKHLARNWVRICFCKSDDTLHKAEERLQKLALFLKK